MLSSMRISVLLPEPMRPMKPTFSPGAMRRLRPLEQRRRIGVAKCTSRNSMRPSSVGMCSAPLCSSIGEIMILSRASSDIFTCCERRISPASWLCRREGTAGSIETAINLAQRKLAVGDQQRANHHQQYGGQACHHDREVAAKGRPFAHPQGALGNLDGQHFPLRRAQASAPMP